MTMTKIKTKKSGFLSAAAVMLGLMAATTPAFAHHSFAAEFDSTKPITLTGIVTKLEWTNPHARFHVSVKDEGGATTAWDFELGSPNGLMRHGWTRNSLKPGGHGHSYGLSGERRFEAGQCAISDFGRRTQDFCGFTRRRRPDPIEEQTATSASMDAGVILIFSCLAPKTLFIPRVRKPC